MMFPEATDDSLSGGSLFLQLFQGDGVDNDVRKL